MGARDEIVAYCQRMVGCAYSHVPSGGVEGQSYNCSYLTTCAYRSAGITIPGWQGHQNGDGSQSDWVRRAGHWTTSASRLLPGDLVFFGTSPASTSHVGVSLGGNRMIDSVPDGGVQERRLYPSFVGGGWPLADPPEVDMLTDDDKAWMENLVKGQLDAQAVRLPRAIWGYRNDGCERKDVYQIIRDIRTTLGVNDGQTIKGDMHTYAKGVIYKIARALGV